MKVSVDWLKDFVQIECSGDELAERLTMVGLEVEDVVKLRPEFEGVVIGRVEDVKPHPDSDHLKICGVDAGDQIVSVVCGAPNVRKGQKVALARVGAVIGGNRRVKSVPIRGVVSEGILCSERELGLSDDHSGILVLDDDGYRVGESFNGGFKEGEDWILDINVTPNRPDCLSIIGIAREIACIFNKELSIPEDSVKESDIPIESFISIRVDDPDGCPRYSARVIRDVKIKQSPFWLRNRLESVGIRSINNVVDVTNYILMETGHPLHAFDYDLIQGQLIVVRKAEDQERFKTLDGKEHTLSKEDLLICDGERGVALAGIMGGLNSEINNQTTNIFLESAYFDPVTVRKTSKRLGISTEASYRFERGADPENTIFAVNRAAKLLSDITECKVAKGILDVNKKKFVKRKIELRYPRIERVVGIEIPEGDVKRILTSLEIESSEEKKESTVFEIPSRRHDLSKEEDLIEEIVRHYGYDRVETNLHTNICLKFFPDEEENLLEEIRDILVGIGFFEVINNSLVSKKHTECFVSGDSPLTIENAISPETKYLRTSLIPCLLDSILWNLNRGEKDLKIFEIGKIFSPKQNFLPDEIMMVSGALTGNKMVKKYWKEEEERVDFFHAKGVIETIIKKLHIDDVEFRHGGVIGLNRDSSMVIVSGPVEIGNIGEVEQAILEKFDIETQVFVFTINCEKLLSRRPKRTRYVQIPRFPSIMRDMAIIVDEGIEVESIRSFIQKRGGKNLISVELFDLYRGKQIDPGKKSLAFRLTFMSKKRTLKEDEIDPIIDSLLHQLQNKFSAALRS